MGKNRDYFLYTGAKTNEISFPLGGLGAGGIGLAGNGRLVDWEIRNRPDKGSLNGFSHFAIKAEAGGKLVEARVLHGDLHPPYTGHGSGPSRATLAGMPHFRSVAFRGEFPIAQLEFEGEHFPGRVTLTAFSPFIPLNDKDTGLPAAFFEFEITNSTDQRLDYTLAGVLANMLPAHTSNEVAQHNGLTLLHLTSDAHQPEAVEYGDLTLATDAKEVSWQRSWYTGSWFDSLEVYWRDFTAPGKFRDRVLPREVALHEHPGTLAAHVSLDPGQSTTVRFVITWNFPNCENYWDEHAKERAQEAGVPAIWRNYYATIWQDSADSARYALTEWGRLYGETRRFKEALFASSLPPAVLDAVSATLSVLKSPTVLRLADGTFYGFEGCHDHAGCCEGSCTHVWNYQQALAFLFPALERSMREVDYHYNLRPDGGMGFRLQLPLGSGRSSFRPCADGQFGGVMKAYRDWKICGDTEWLRGLWPAIKQSIEFAWAETNEDQWDPEQTGVLWGRQHHTLDVELFGPNSWLTGFYLGALKAGVEIAEALGEPETAAQYRDLFARGKTWVDEHLFNGAYYHQQIDLRDRAQLQRFGDAYDYYWSEEHGEVKYQIADGCGVDQVLPQWHANLYGLGEIYSRKQTRTALASLFRHNFRPQMRDYANPHRLYCLNDEGGLVIVHWPEGTYHPMMPVPYASETFYGFEYAAASHMIQEGLIEEGLAVAAAVRFRHDGERRNPWNEIECGHNYARSMAAYALLNAYSGFQFDMTKGLIGFDPIREEGDFRCFWSLDSGWGQVACSDGAMEVEVLSGRLALQRLRLPGVVSSVTLNGQPVAFTREGEEVVFAEAVTIGEGGKLRATTLSS